MDTITFKASALTIKTVNDYDVLRCRHKKKAVLTRIYKDGEKLCLHNDDYEGLDYSNTKELDESERKDAHNFLLQKFFILYNMPFSEQVTVRVNKTEESMSLDRALDIYIDCVSDKKRCTISKYKINYITTK